MGIVGPNGSGKTALLRALTGLHDTQGSVLLDGRDIRSIDPCECGIFYVSDDCGIFDMTVRENLEFFYGCYNDPGSGRMDRDIENILEATKLKGRANSSADSLSLGMRRRLAYAMTMVAVPSVLIMDDPFSNLDTDGRIYLEGYLRTLKMLGTAIVISSHDLINLQGICDSVLILRGGYVKGTIPVDKEVDLSERYLSMVRGDTG